MKWVKHDTDANQDAKLQNVLLDYGLEGYGLYWYCIELIAGKVDKNNYTFELEHDARIIARNTGSTPQKVEEMMRYFVKSQLFEDVHGVITCLKIAKRLDQSMTSNPQMREIINNLKNHDGVMTASESPMQDQIRLDEIREDKTLQNNATSRFGEFWDIYNKKVDSKKCKAKFDKLKQSEIEDLFKSLPGYINSTPDPRFRKNPLTWLNGKCWNDEQEDNQEQLIDHSAVIEIFNESMRRYKEVPKALDTTPGRIRMINSLVEVRGMNINGFKSYFDHISNNNQLQYFLTGAKIPARGIDHFLKDDVFMNIKEAKAAR